MRTNNNALRLFNNSLISLTSDSNNFLDILQIYINQDAYCYFYKMKFLFLLNCLLLSSWPTHKFYFSETLIEWKDPSTLQVTIKVFADDLENATQTNQPDYKQDLLDSLYSSYIQLHFQIIDNNEAPIQLEFIGHEKDGEFIYLYLENNHFDKKTCWCKIRF